MDMMLLLLVWSSIAGEANSNCIELTQSDAKLTYIIEERSMSCEMEADVMIKCDNKTNTTTTVDTTITPKSICCRNNTPTKDVPATTTVQTRATHTEKTTISLCTCQDVKCATSIGLGVVVGLLVALLAVITTGWMWTCWTTKRRQRITTNSRDISNPSYGGNQQTHFPTPTYETIPPLSTLMDGIKLELGESKEEGTAADIGNNTEEAYHKLNRAQRDDEMREGKDQSHRGMEANHGTGPQEIQHSYANASTEQLLLNSAVFGEEERSASQENKLQENSSVKENDRELHGTTGTPEYNHDQATEQDLPKRKAIPRDYELAVPSK